MAKYDSWKLIYQPKLAEGLITAELTILFEQGDNIDNVMNEARDRMQARILNLQALSKLK